MRLSKKVLKHRRNHRSAARKCSAEMMERRLLMSSTGEYIATPIPPVLANLNSPASNSVTLNQYFNDTTLPGTLVTFTTSEGTVQVGLTDAATPLTVANFLNYVDSGEYNDTIFHRSVDLSTGNNASPSDPATIVQGGGYNISGGGLSHIPTNAPVNDEYKSELYGDVAGTLAMAKTSSADSATSEWYFNTQDNTELDTPTTDSEGNQTSYTVFGKVLSGLSVLQTIAALPTDDLGNGLTAVPIAGLTEAQIQAGASISASNLVFTEEVEAEPGTSYTVSSDNTALVTPKVTDGVLSFTYGSGYGTAAVTINAKNLDGTSASTEMLVTVPNPSTPAAGPVATNVTAPFTVTGTTGSFPVLGSSTDSLAPLDPSAVTIISGPTHGTATVNTTDGYINYTPNTGFVGKDTLTFTVGDTSGSVSNVATVTLQAVPTAVQVTVGSAGVKALNFVQPDGSLGHLSIVNGYALVTFSSFQVTLTGPTNGVLTASGPGTIITSVAVTDRTTNGELDVTAKGPVTLGAVTDQEHLQINAPEATLSGECHTGSSNYIRIAALNNADLILGLSPVLPNLFIGSVLNSDVTSQSEILNIDSSQWLTTDGSTHTIAAPGIQFMRIFGEFDESLNLTSTGYDIFDCKVATPGGAWDLDGSAFQINSGTPTTNWSLSANGLIHTLNLKGNLANNITAAAIGTMLVTGTTTGATIQTSAGFSPKFLQIGSINFQGAVSNTVVFSAGNIGSITAASFTDSRVYAGVAISVAENGALATGTSDLSDDAKINAFILKNTGAGFSGAEISADIIGSLNLGKIITAAANLPEGVSAHKIGSITGTLSPGGVLRAGPAQLKTPAALTAYETKAKLTLGQFSINLF